MERTLYFCRSSLESGDDMIFRRTCEGALKWRLRFLLRSEVTKGLNFMATVCKKSRGRERRGAQWGAGTFLPPPLLPARVLYGKRWPRKATEGVGWGM